MMEAAASIGMTVGPIVGGSLKELFGYDYMSWTWSRWLTFLLVTSLMVIGLLYLFLAVLVMCFLGSEDPNEMPPADGDC